MSASDIVGYTFQADVFCPGCIVGVALGEQTEAFDEEEFADFEEMCLAYSTGILSTERELKILAKIRGVNYGDESSYDSDDFPKAILEQQLEGGEMCGRCGDPIAD